MSIYKERWQYFSNLTASEFEKERKKISDKYSKFELRTEETRERLDTERLAFNDVEKYKRENTKERTSITFRCSEQEKMFINTLAQERNITMSDLIIELVSEKMADFKAKAKKSKKLTKQKVSKQ